MLWLRVVIMELLIIFVVVAYDVLLLTLDVADGYGMLFSTLC